MKGKIAGVIGGTGLIGSHLLNLLTNDDHFESVRVLVRRPVEFSSPKLHMRLLSFDDKEAFKMAIDGCDTVFCAVGTTEKKVQGDKNAFYKVDHDIPILAAQFCEETNCPHLLVVSSIGASIVSRHFYLKLKGEMEAAVLSRNISAISIFRPSQLLGKRNESRPREDFVQKIMSTFSFVIPTHYKPIHARQVAMAMLQVSKMSAPQKHIYENEEILRFENMHE